MINEFRYEKLRFCTNIDERDINERNVEVRLIYNAIEYRLYCYYHTEREYILREGG
jgi:hypothetical protein